MKGDIPLLRGRLTSEGGRYPGRVPSAIVAFRPATQRLVPLGVMNSRSPMNRSSGQPIKREIFVDSIL
jgi:hypothetical protein